VMVLGERDIFGILGWVGLVVFWGGGEKVVLGEVVYVWLSV
jgi:hypothetical protein